MKHDQHRPLLSSSSGSSKQTSQQQSGNDFSCSDTGNSSLTLVNEDFSRLFLQKNVGNFSFFLVCKDSTRLFLWSGEMETVHQTRSGLEGRGKGSLGAFSKRKKDELLIDFSERGL